MYIGSPVAGAVKHPNKKIRLWAVVIPGSYFFGILSRVSLYYVASPSVCPVSALIGKRRILSGSNLVRVSV
jgi:hypothetical protein